MAMTSSTTTSPPCPDPACKVAYWTNVIERGAWEGKARDRDDARMALGAAELLCKVFHGKGSACTCKYVPLDYSGKAGACGCLIHDPERAVEAAQVRARLIETTRRAGL